MNLGKGFPFSEENYGEPWKSVPPQKPVMHPNPVRLTGDQPNSRNLPYLPANCSSRYLTEKQILGRSNPIQNSARLANHHTASSSLGPFLGCPSITLPEKYVLQNFNSIHANMQGNHTESTIWQRPSGIFDVFSLNKQNLINSNHVITNMRGNQRESIDWQELLGVYSDLLQPTPQSDKFYGKANIQDDPVAEANRCKNYNADSYLQKKFEDNPIINGNTLVQSQESNNAPYPLPADQPPSRSIYPGRDTSAGNNRTEHQCANTMSPQQKHTWDPNQDICTCNLHHIPSHELPISYQPSYNLNSPPRKETVRASFTTNCFQIAPLTPDQGKQSKNHRLPAIDNISVDKSPIQEKDKLEMACSNRQEVSNHCDQQLQSVEQSHSSNSISLKEKSALDDRSCEGIDLNKTPQLRPPKRKKHRPKVVVEGKPKRTPKPSPLKTSKETPSGKRKYVRKKGLKDSTPQNNEINLGENHPVQFAAKPCKRALNFDVEDKVQDKGQYKTANKKPESQNERFDLNLTSHGTASPTELNRTSTMLAANEEQQKIYSAEKQQSGSTCNLMDATDQKSADESLPFAPIAPANTAKDRALNIIARTINLHHQKNNHNGYIQVHQQIHGEGMSQLPLQANTAWSKLDRAKQLMLQTRIRFDQGGSEANEKGANRRDCCNISDLRCSPTVNLMHLLSNGEQKNDNSKSELGNSEIHKKKRFEDKCQEPASSTPSYTSVKSSRQFESRGTGAGHVSCSPYTNCRLTYSNLGSQNSSGKQTSNGNNIANANDQSTDPIAVVTNFQEQRSLSEMKLHRDSMAGQFCNQLAEYSGSTDQNLLPSSQRVPLTTQANVTGTYVVKVVKRQKVGLKSPIAASGEEKLLQNDNKGRCYLPFSAKARGQKEEQEHAPTIDEVICQLKGLQITSSGQPVVREEQTAVVPYKGDGTIVPYEGFDPIRRRKPRPKVDLDPETERQWNLLMGKPGTESTEAMDKDKEKWWEEERKVFRGRIDSFIARMHLVQGDRRFSRWKGSVVDSVVGVFLTQNVSDHLSSSAFMSLASKFPLPKILNPASAWTEEPEVQIIDPDGTTTYHGRITRKPLYKHNSRASSESSEHRSDHLIMETGVNFRKENGKAAQEEAFSSQNSSESLILQANEDVQTPSDSEVEDQVIMRNTNKSQSCENILQTERSASLQQHQSQEIRNSLLDSRPTAECQQMPTPLCISQNSVVNIGYDVYGYPIESYQQARRLNEAGRHPSIEPLSSESNNIPNLRKRKLNDRIKSFDWDTLRKQVLAKGGKQKRYEDKMDSMDYEALRHADFKKISDTIKQRGMNNMLAERIKDFLNRLVRDHGSIDLEWLRDVPPDKAKEYLLSIRGLGLKSVECVRLLTLHHVAFPVDTNVGRIAVRLGWVPLQPLPERLQLHLLELYPVLESIQKYLWPRLCKLDQRTLYELHYQMITFGKVFCTKNKPNCNACPLRAECRHFASAFASARLALPGPEERSIVSSASTVATNASPTPVIKLMPPLPLETYVVTESHYTSSHWEPIIEEPTTPEASTEVSEVDIEDLLSEDVEEIPTIDLSFEQLKLNVQSIIQEQNMEIPEGDLSRALVALNPADASIPAPKLKNVSQLRTEHQVYEIPDSHPLLIGMDRREPDDPSPYLLAIWTPGETADSTQPPESICDSQVTGILCNEKTCFSCNSIREADSQIVRGTLLIPCRTAMRGSFPLNGTYFQVNEVFADYQSSDNPIKIPRNWLWQLQRRTVYFGTSVSAIFRGLSTVGIQYCFWKGFVCVRSFDRETRAPRPLSKRLHVPASNTKSKKENK